MAANKSARQKSRNRRKNPIRGVLHGLTVAFLAVSMPLIGKAEMLEKAKSKQRNSAPHKQPHEHSHEHSGHDHTHTHEEEHKHRHRRRNNAKARHMAGPA